MFCIYTLIIQLLSSLFTCRYSYIYLDMALARLSWIDFLSFSKLLFAVLQFYWLWRIFSSRTDILFVDSFRVKLQFHIVTLFLLSYRFEFANLFIFKSQLFLYLFDMVLFHSQLLLNLLKNQGLLQELVFLLLFLLPQFLTVWNLLYAFTWSRISSFSFH